MKSSLALVLLALFDFGLMFSLSGTITFGYISRLSHGKPDMLTEKYLLSLSLRLSSLTSQKHALIDCFFVYISWLLIWNTVQSCHPKCGTFWLSNTSDILKETALLVKYKGKILVCACSLVEKPLVC